MIDELAKTTDKKYIKNHHREV